MNRPTPPASCLNRFRFQTVLTRLVVLLGSLLLAMAAWPQDHVGDRAALEAVYEATNGPNWSNNENWLSEEPLSKWYGVTVHNGRLTEPLPSELGNLTNLQELDLSSNGLTGPIPSELGNPANLHCLSLFVNQLTGSIPPELGNLVNLHRRRL